MRMKINYTDRSKHCKTLVHSLNYCYCSPFLATNQTITIMIFQEVLVYVIVNNPVVKYTSLIMSDSSEGRWADLSVWHQKRYGSCAWNVQNLYSWPRDTAYQ